MLVLEAAALALQAQAVEVASLAGGEWLLVAHGTGLQLEEALNLPQAWAPTELALEIGESGAVLLGAVHTVDRGRTLEGASLELTMASGRYDVRVLSDGMCEAWRLTPSKARAPRKTAPRRRRS
jgi:hypothetical protein